MPVRCLTQTCSLEEKINTATADGLLTHLRPNRCDVRLCLPCLMHKSSIARSAEVLGCPTPGQQKVPLRRIVLARRNVEAHLQYIAIITLLLLLLTLN